LSKPNILLITSDQMRADAMGCSGNPDVKTPHLDRLAQSGVCFTNAFTPDPICVPARASITTGCYPHRCTGFKDNKGAIRAGFPLLGEELNQRGYRTYALGKLHYLPYTPPGEKRTTYGIETVELAESGRIVQKYDPYGCLKGLEDYHDYLYTVGWGGYTRGHGLGNNDIFAAASPIPEEYYVDAWVADRTIYHLERHLEGQPDTPFFLWMSFPKPHSPYDPPRPYDSMYDPRSISPPVGDFSKIQNRGLDFFVREYFNHMWDKVSPEAKRVIKSHYYGLVSFQDRQIGRVLDFLEAKGLREDTIIIYTADHGDMLGDFGLFFKRNFYNGSVRIPFIVSYPRRVAAGRISRELVGLQDILPTLMSLTGTPLHRPVDGEDLTPVLEGHDSSIREYYVGQCMDHPQQQYMVVDGEWKYIYHQLGGVEELYNQLQDPHELNNLADSKDAPIKVVRHRMREYLRQWCIENGDQSMLENGELVVYPREEFKIPQPGGVFGRRYY